MSSPVLPTGLSEIAADYDAILCDVWGVIHNGREAFAQACAALERFRRERGPVVLISNAPRPSTALYSQLESVGVPRTVWSGFVTSGDATRALLSERVPGPAWVLGPPRDTPLYEGLGLTFAERIPEAAFIVCTGPFNEETETPEDYRERLALAQQHDLEMICANPDRMVQKGDRLIYCAGALAELYQSLGGRTVMAGKPYAPIYAMALSELSRIAGHTVDISRVLCIGDGVSTDVLGAQLRGLDCLFLWEGVHAADLAKVSDGPAAERAALFLATHSTSAKYAMPELVW
jgi:HAD superfamily hydrolase (TIGR01459 family)